MQSYIKNLSFYIIFASRINPNIHSKMKKVILAAALLTATAAAGASEAPLWLRNPAISPDGRTIAFTYRGDIFTVATSGGLARQITTNPAYDTAPVWSPD